MRPLFAAPLALTLACFAPTSRLTDPSIDAVAAATASTQENSTPTDSLAPTTHVDPTTGADDGSTGATSDGTGPASTSAPAPDLPPPVNQCGEPGHAWGPCVDGTCVDGSACWLAESGWFCSPICDGGCEPCAEESLGEMCGVDQQRCWATCAASQDCPAGMLCDDATDVCVWPADCGPAGLHGPWYGCDAGNQCSDRALCSEASSGGVCASACATDDECGEPIICGVPLGAASCVSGRCVVACETDADCVAGMRCETGRCYWPSVP